MLKRISKDFVVIFGTFFQKKKDAEASFQVLCQNLWLFLVEQRLEDIPRQERKKVHGHGITVENKLV
ncbi:MAG: hypothetical protein RIS89_722 [Bacteroidota bacterium]